MNQDRRTLLAGTIGGLAVWLGASLNWIKQALGYPIPRDKIPPEPNPPQPRPVIPNSVVYLHMQPWVEAGVGRIRRENLQLWIGETAIDVDEVRCHTYDTRVLPAVDKLDPPITAAEVLWLWAFFSGGFDKMFHANARLIMGLYPHVMQAQLVADLPPIPWLPVTQPPEPDPCGRLIKLLVASPVIPGGWGRGWYDQANKRWTSEDYQGADPRITHYALVKLP